MRAAADDKEGFVYADPLAAPAHGARRSRGLPVPYFPGWPHSGRRRDVARVVRDSG